MLDESPASKGEGEGKRTYGLANLKRRQNSQSLEYAKAGYSGYSDKAVGLSYTVEICKSYRRTDLPG